MSDEEIRRLERAVAEGDLEAGSRLWYLKEAKYGRFPFEIQWKSQSANRLLRKRAMPLEAIRVATGLACTDGRCWAIVRGPASDNYEKHMTTWALAVRYGDLVTVGSSRRQYEFVPTFALDDPDHDKAFREKRRKDDHPWSSLVLPPDWETFSEKSEAHRCVIITGIPKPSRAKEHVLRRREMLRLDMVFVSWAANAHDEDSFGSMVAKGHVDQALAFAAGLVP